MAEFYAFRKAMQMALERACPTKRLECCIQNGKSSRLRSTDLGLVSTCPGVGVGKVLTLSEPWCGKMKGLDYAMSKASTALQSRSWL